jgi:alkanesulfonate monooxygenase SsuD/methylene tetrahydromethanopterin reductase-like flavin-dependent oxidoreductase (luciferase family)
LADRRRRGALAIVVAMSLGSGAELACGDGEGRPPAWKEPRDAQIRETLDAVWAAVGLRPDQVDVAEYAYTFAPDSTACAQLAADDRWFGERGSSARAEGFGRAEIEDAIVAYLEGEGFTVQRYRSSHPDSPARSLQGVKGELVVYASPDPGYASVNVRSGPCAPAFSRFDSDLFEPDV